MINCKCFECPLPDCVDPCPFGMDGKGKYVENIDEYLLDNYLKTKEQEEKEKREKKKAYFKEYYLKNKSRWKLRAEKHKGIKNIEQFEKDMFGDTR